MLLRLERMVHGGVALARLSGGRLALVRGGLPGERVKTSLKERAGVLQGTVDEIVDASPHRVPPSPHPGLDYSYMAYSHQLELKRSVVADALTRSLKRAVAVPPVVAAPHVWGYRHAVQPAVNRCPSGVEFGYRHPESHAFAPLEGDPVAHGSINGAWKTLRAQDLPKGIREVAFRAGDAGQVLLCLVASASPKHYLDLAHALVREGLAGVSYARFDPRGRFRSGSERLAGARAVTQRYGPFQISVSATSFAQPNPEAASRLYAELARWAGTGARAVDLYAGSGIIGLHLTGAFERVIALDIDRGSVVRGARDARRLGVRNLEFARMDARRAPELPQADLITVDPPRAGLAKGARQAIIASSASRLLYVACDVATWARDVSHFEAAGWRLERLQPFDFYPQTHHVEMLSLLTREV